MNAKKAVYLFFRSIQNVLFFLFILRIPQINSINLDVNNPESIRETTSFITENVMYYFSGTPGLFKGPVYWWQSGAAWNSLLDYSRYTGDKKWNKLIIEAILSQAGENRDLLPIQFRLSQGNDDQTFWAFTAMTAAETNLENPPPNEPQWLELVQAVFNEQVERWDEQNCRGGLRWQIFPYNLGYTYKNTVSNGAFFQLAARLARYTNNETYARWAEKAYVWMEDIKFINLTTYAVYDGAETPNCYPVTRVQWSYNNGLLMAGSAFMYDFTKDPKWKDRVYRYIFKAKKSFYRNNGILCEPACEFIKTCNQDQMSFKAYLSRFMGYTMNLMPDTISHILPLLKSSSIAAAGACSGPPSGHHCGMNWQASNYDGWDSLGSQMSALETMLAILAPNAMKPLTSDTGGTSKADPNNVYRDRSLYFSSDIRPPTIADKACAGLLTVLVVIGALAFFAWLIV